MVSRNQVMTRSLSPSFFLSSGFRSEDLNKVCTRNTTLQDYPFAASIKENIILYEGDSLRREMLNPGKEFPLKTELCHCLKEGPGVFVITEAIADLSIIDEMTVIFRKILEKEKISGENRGDHFGNNERIWNSIQKTCILAPDLFIDYYGNALLALACRAWLGPQYQMTAQVNIVKPGSEAQSAHRDYHLGFQSDEAIAEFPAHAQVMSQYLTLQGAIVHSDMPLETGPTLFLPYSHQYSQGYGAIRNPVFTRYFEDHHVQLPLHKGDAVFFNPALFHAAGKNSSTHDRIANLVQISSPFGKTMETINHCLMIEAVYPVLLARIKNGTISDTMIRDTVIAIADGYSFPTNLDSDPPIDGNAPESACQIIHRALTDHWPMGPLKDALNAYSKRRQA